MIHGVRDEMLALLDRLRRLRCQFVVHIHVVDICGRVYGNDILSKLVLVVQSWPVLAGCYDFGYLLELTELGGCVKEMSVNLFREGPSQR